MRQIAVNIARVLLAVTFILSGFVKAVDPLGTQYKIRDYLNAMHLGQYVPDYLTLGASVTISAMEFLIGKLLISNLHNLGIYKMTRDGLKEMGIDLKDLAEQESEQAQCQDVGAGKQRDLADIDRLLTLCLAGKLVSQRQDPGFQQQLKHSFPLPEARPRRP